MIDYSNYTFFWHGPLSQWYHSDFVIDDIMYNTAEQYMMHQKALLFNDTATAEKIMLATSPRDQKRYGREVVGFDKPTWDGVAQDIVYRGNYAKYTQDQQLFMVLKSTVPTLLVEASPRDSIWGIGISEATAKTLPPDEWPGLNWLGIVLTHVRDDLLHGN